MTVGEVRVIQEPNAMDPFEGGSIRIIQADKTAEFSMELLEHAKPEFLTYVDDVITITASNRTVRYRVVERKTNWTTLEHVEGRSTVLGERIDDAAD